MTYRIVRYYQSSPKEVLDTGLTLAEVQAYCSRDDTRGEGWFDGFEREDDDDA